MKRFNNNGKSVWGSSRPDVFPNGSSRRQQPVGCRDFGNYNRRPFDDGEMEKFDRWRDETDLRFDSVDPILSRETEPPLGFDVGDDGEYDDVWRRKPRDGGCRAKNPNWGFRDPTFEERGRRCVRGGSGSGGDVPGNRYVREQFGGFPQRWEKPTSCWDPPQRYQASAAGFDKSLVSMKPPRFDGSDATNWISRVQYYFDHVMMPDAQRFHYAVMLFDPPASEWVFNYCTNNGFVTWHEFLEDVRHRFVRQSFNDYFGLIAKLTQTGTVLEYHDTFEKYLNRVQGVPASKLFTLFVAGLKPGMQERLSVHRPTSLAAAMALSLELADTQAERSLAQPSSGFQRKQWQGRDNRSSTHQPPATASGPSLSSGPMQRQKEQPRQPTIRVSQAERSERSRLGLCWHCPEKWVMGHVCKQRILCYADDGEEFEDNIQDENLAEEKTDNTPTIVFGDDVPNDITNVHNDGAPLDVPNNESPGEFLKNKWIVKDDNEPPQVLVGVCDEKIGEKEETLLEDKEEGGSIGEVEKIVASLNVVQVSSKNVVGNCWGKKGDGAYTDFPVIACVYVDLNVGDVPSMNHRSTSLDKDARLIPPSNDMPCLGILGGVDKLFDLARNFSNKVGSPLLIFYGSEEGIRSSVRCVFDPGGVASPKLLLSTLLFCFVVPTLRTRWILTVGELIRTSIIII